MWGSRILGIVGFNERFYGYFVLVFRVLPYYCYAAKCILYMGFAYGLSDSNCFSVMVSWFYVIVLLGLSTCSCCS